LGTSSIAKLKKKLLAMADTEVERTPEPPNMENLTRFLLKLIEESKQRGNDPENSQADIGLVFSRNQFKQDIMLYDYTENDHNLDKAARLCRMSSQAEGKGIIFETSNSIPWLDLQEGAGFMASMDPDILEESEDDQHLQYLYHPECISTEHIEESIRIATVHDGLT
jgi:hypothetical protein